MARLTPATAPPGTPVLVRGRPHEPAVLGVLVGRPHSRERYVDPRRVRPEADPGESPAAGRRPGRIGGHEPGGVAGAVSDPPPTIHGYEPFEVISALQKAVRRGDVDGTLYWIAELDRSGYTAWCWKRLLVFASEDVGAADPHLVATIHALHEIHRDLAKKDPNDGRLQLMHAGYLLATAPKSRALVMAACWFFSDTHERLPIPDHAKDRHTAAGRRMRRGWKHFRAEAAKLEYHRPVPEEALWDEKGYAAIEGTAEVVNPPVDRRPDGPPSLFSTDP